MDPFVAVVYVELLEAVAFHRLESKKIQDAKISSSIYEVLDLQAIVDSIHDERK